MLANNNGPDDPVQEFNNIQHSNSHIKHSIHHQLMHLSLSAPSQPCWTAKSNNQTKMPTISNFYTLQDASLHNTKDDCWIVVNGKVYDVTQYLDDHPGGDDVLIAATGKDATDDFEDAGHSKSARELMEEYYIGELDTSSSPVSTEQHYSEKFMQLTKQYWAIPAAVVGISVVVGFLYLRKK